MQSARGCIQLEKTAKDAEGARRGITRRSSSEGSMFGDARMQLLKPEEHACMQRQAYQRAQCQVWSRLRVLQAPCHSSIARFWLANDSMSGACVAQGRTLWPTCS